MTEIYLELINSEFSGDEAEKIEYASLVGFAVDSIGKNDHLEGIYRCYVPFFALQLTEGNYAIANAMLRDKNKLSVSKLPNLSEVKKILDSDIKMQEKYKQVENLLLKKSVEEVEISGILGKKGTKGINKLITLHNADQDSNYKKLAPIISRDEIQNQLKLIANAALTESEVDSRIDNFVEQLEQAFADEIKELEQKKKNIEKEYNEKLKQKKTEVEKRLAEIDKEEAAEKKRIDEEMVKQQKRMIEGVKEANRWNQMKNDIEGLSSAYSKLTGKINSIKTGDDLDSVLKQINVLQDEVHAFGVGLNTAATEIKNRKFEYDDSEQQAEVDKRNVTDRLNTIREEEKSQLNMIKNEKEKQLQETDEEIRDAKEVLQQVKRNKKNLKKQILDNYEMSSTFTVSGDVLGIPANAASATIYVPVAIARSKARNELHHLVIPPFEIPENMKTGFFASNFALTSENGTIGFDCIAIELLDFLKEPLKQLLEADQNLQNEIQGSNNELLATGDLIKFNSGFNILEQRKKFKEKDSEKLLAMSRKYL